MKAFVALFALLAAAAAESDPALIYSGALPYAGYGYSHLGYSNLGYSNLYNHGVYPYAHTYAAGFAGFDGVGRPAIKSAPCTNVDGEPVDCRITKRDADADPALIYSRALPYAGYGYSHLGYSNLYNHAYPYAHTYARAGFAGFHASGAPAIKAAPCTAANGRPVPCAHGLYKRDADAEADPALIYSGALPYAGYGYSNLGYSNLYNHGVYGYPYAHTYARAGFAGFDGVGRPAIKAAPCTNAWGKPVHC